MMLKFHLFLLFIFQGLFAVAQVGINQPNPTATLDVRGNVLVQDKLYLENPGRYLGDENSKLLMVNNNGNIIQYNIANNPYGPINYVQYVFKNTSNSGLVNGFNTKISATKYKLAVHGFSFNRLGNGNITLRKTSGNPSRMERFIEGHQFYAYIGGPSNNRTWFIKGFVNDSQFFLGPNLSNVDIYMDVLIYRNDFITKFFPQPRIVNMNKQRTAIATLPFGF